MIFKFKTRIKIKADIKHTLLTCKSASEYINIENKLYKFITIPITGMRATVPHKYQLTVCLLH